MTTKVHTVYAWSTKKGGSTEKGESSLHFKIPIEMYSKCSSDVDETAVRQTVENASADLMARTGDAEAAARLSETHTADGISGKWRYEWYNKDIGADRIRTHDRADVRSSTAQALPTEREDTGRSCMTERDIQNKLLRDRYSNANPGESPRSIP